MIPFAQTRKSTLSCCEHCRPGSRIRKQSYLHLANEANEAMIFALLSVAQAFTLMGALAASGVYVASSADALL